MTFWEAEMLAEGFAALLTHLHKGESEAKEKPEVTPTSRGHAPRKPGHFEMRTVRRQGSKSPFQQRFYIAEKEQAKKKKKKDGPDTVKLHALSRKLGKLLRERDLPKKAAERAHVLREKIQAILTEHRNTTLSGISSEVRSVASSRRGSSNKS